MKSYYDIITWTKWG